MMKKIIVSSFAILFTLIMIIPTSVFATEYQLADGVTFGQFQDDLAKAEKELNANNQSINNNKNQINADNATIKKLKSEIEEMGVETNKLQQEIAESNINIAERKKQTKDVISYYQMSQGENIYLEYVFGGDSITDLVYRLSIVEQITEYNEKVMKELEGLIEANEKRKVELANKEKECENKINSLNAEISKLTNSVSKLGELSPGLEQEVKTKRDLVDFYKNQGCKNRSDVIGKDCAVSSSNGQFSRPIKTGYITSFIGYRWGSLHRGLDMGSSLGRNTPLYSVGYGRITSIWRDGNGANNVNIEYRGRDGKYYTAIYAHLSRYGNIYKNMEVTPNTIIGYMGDTGFVTGVHLHLELWPCRLYVDKECKTWNSYVNFVSKQYKSGFKGAESVINFPSRTYQTWYTK